MSKDEAKAAEIQKTLAPTHLQGEQPPDDLAIERPTSDELKQEMEKAAEPTDAKEDEKARDAKRKLMSEKDYPFDFEWGNEHGKVWKGKFVDRILSIGNRSLAGAMRARMGAGLPADSLDPLTQEVNLMVSHMAFSLIEKPDWAEDLLALEDVRLIQALYAEVSAHEGMFLGYYKPETEG